jgi:2-phospho-L-lactate guanylyltransferase (CobY/MobA/RfbA family)
MTYDAFLVPLKQFDLAKDRLRKDATLDVSKLAEELARGVLQSCGTRKVFVLSESPEITSFATQLGIEVVQSHSSGLNEAVANAYAALESRYERLHVVHGDLKNPDGLSDFVPTAAITIVSDHHGSGTNVLSLPTGLDFHFHYGVGSRFLHEQEAQRLGIEFSTILGSPWGYDVDEPTDLQ